MRELTVYVVSSSSGWVSGVYSTEEIAEDHAQSLRESRDGDTYEVSAHVLDA